MEKIPQSRLNHWKVLRKSLFWFHLAIGVISGIFIASMCITGSLMAFKKEALSVLDPQTITIESWQPLSPSELLATVQADHPEMTVEAIEVNSDPGKVWRLRVGRKEFKPVNPYTGKLIESSPWQKFFHDVEEFHRWLLLKDDAKTYARHVTGGANLCFAALAMTGLYLWFPRKATWKMWKFSLFYKRGAKAKARDFNWHNVTGFWIVLPLAVITTTGTTFHYQWSKDLAVKILGEPLPRSVEIPATENLPPLDIDEQLNIAISAVETWKLITLPVSPDTRLLPEDKAVNPPLLPTVMIHDDAFRFPNVPTQIVIDPRSREIITRRSSEDFTLPQKVHASFKALHTGDAWYLPGKIIAFLACIGGLVLIYTGFALSFRRLRRRINFTAP